MANRLHPCFPEGGPVFFCHTLFFSYLCREKPSCCLLVGVFLGGEGGGGSVRLTPSATRQPRQRFRLAGDAADMRRRPCILYMSITRLYPERGKNVVTRLLLLLV